MKYETWFLVELDEIWFYFHKIVAQGRITKYNMKEEGKKTQYNQKQNYYEYINRKEKNKAQLGSSQAKEKIESKKSNYESLLLINST